MFAKILDTLFNSCFLSDWGLKWVLQTKLSGTKQDKIGASKMERL